MNKPIIVQGAMKIELDYIKEKLYEIEEIIIDGYNYIKGNLNGYPVILSETKIGTINSTISTLIGIKKFNPLCVINQGVAGGQAENIHKNDLVIGSGCINLNSYESNKKSIGEGCNPFEWNIVNFISDETLENYSSILKSDSNLIKYAEMLSDKNNKRKVHIGLLGSGDAWDKEADRIVWINKKTGAISADMESIGAYTVANKYKVPVIGIRIISDNYILNEDYERDVAYGAQEFVIELIKKIIENKDD